MEDILYIVLGIIWLIISIVGGKKKKKQTTPQPRQNTTSEQGTSSSPVIEQEPTTEKPKGANFEDMLEEFFGGDSSTKENSPTNSPVAEEDQSYAGYGEEILEESQERKVPEKIKEFEGTMQHDFEFTTEGKIETLEDRIKAIEKQDRETAEKDNELKVVDLDGGEIDESKGIDFDARKAIIYSEIINRKYF